jgi:hypothetical protein
VDRWCRARDLPRGSVISLDQCWRLARAWYHDRLDPDWRRKTPDEVTVTFDSIGLCGEFWKVEPHGQKR